MDLLNESTIQSNPIQKMRTLRYKHCFTSPLFPGEEIGTFGKSATDHDKVKDHLGYRWEETAVHSRTETFPYKYAPIVADIIAALPGDWDAEPVGDEYEDTGFNLIREDGLRLWISGPSYRHKGKFHIGFSAPNGIDGRRINDIYEMCDGSLKQFRPESANVAETKTGEQIAKDIARRVLPSAEKAQSLCLEKIAKESEAQDAREVSLARICQVTGKPLPEKSERYPEYRYSMHLQLQGSGYGSIEINAGGSVCIELRSLSPEHAESVLKALLA